MGQTVRQAWVLRFGVAIVAVALVFATGLGPAMGGKPSAPPSGKTIYYSASGAPYRMAADGTGKTALAGQLGYRISDTTYDDGKYWTVDYKRCDASEPATPEGYARYKLIVGPLDSDEPAAFELLNDDHMNPWLPNFRPGGTYPTVTFVAVVWDADNGDAVSAGLYQIEFSLDGEYIGDPELLLPCGTFNEWSDPTYEETAAEMTWHDWYDATTIVYGDDSFAGYGAGGWHQEAQLYYGDIEADPDTHVPLIADGNPLMLYGPQFNSSGTKVVYPTLYGISEVATVEGSTPTVLVTNDRSKLAGWADYLSDDTIVYTWVDLNRHTQDICSKKAGVGAKNLTADTSAWCGLCGAR